MAKNRKSGTSQPTVEQPAPIDEPQEDPDVGGLEPEHACDEADQNVNENHEQDEEDYQEDEEDESEEETTVKIEANGEETEDLDDKQTIILSTENQLQENTPLVLPLKFKQNKRNNIISDMEIMKEKESQDVEDPLIKRQFDKNLLEDEDGDLRTQVIDEVKRQIELAGPLIAVSLLQYSLEVISIMFAGHFGQLSLSSASMATCFASFSGFSVLLGMSGALETLCGQAYGAKQYHMLGIQMQRGMITLTAVSIPLAIIWYYTTTIFIAIGQDEEISVGAGTYIRWMIPSIFAYSLLQSLNKFLQTQNIVTPVMITSGATALLHIFICWVLVIKFGLEIKGAALASTISNWINVVLLGVYVKLSPACKHTWTGFSKEAMNDLLSFLKLAVPSAVMNCLEYWTFDTVVLLSGLLPNPKLETSVLSISLDTCFIVYMISVGLGGAISTRVSNELGAGRPKAARLAIYVVVIIAILEGMIVGTITILVRHVYGRLYSNDEEVINYIAKMMQLLALSDFLDGFQCVLSGAARGCGWQNICVIMNLGAYYIVGIPCSLLFAFVFHIGGMGLWMGIICALSVQVVALVAINLSTNWNIEALKAINRVSNKHCYRMTLRS